MSGSAVQQLRARLTSDLIVRSDTTGGAPSSLASGPMAMSKGVCDGAWQSYVSLLWAQEGQRCRTSWPHQPRTGG
jgi:hypothetical protein